MSKSITLNALARITMYMLNLLVPVLVGPYLARVLDVGLYAEYNTALSIVQWFLPFAVFGVYTYGMRQASRERDDKERISSVFTQLFVFSIITTSIMLICYTLFALVAKADYFWLYFILGIQITANYFAVEWVNEAFENYGFILYKTAAVRLAYVISIFIFIKDANDILPFAVISSLLIFFNNFFGYVYIKRRIAFKKISLLNTFKLFRTLFPIMLLANANMLFFMLDRLFLSVFSSVDIYITYYTFSMLILVAIFNVVCSIMFVTIPRLSNLLAHGNTVEYSNLLKLSSHSFFLFFMPICAGIASLGNEIMLLYGGNNYIHGGSTLIVFGLCYMISAIDLSMSNQVLFLHGKEQTLLRIYFTGGGLNIACNTVLLLTNHLTPVLLAVTTGISYLIVIILEHMLISRILNKNLSPLNTTTLKYIVTSLCFIPITMIIRRLFHVELVLNSRMVIFVLAVIMICAIFYAAVLYLSKDEVYLHFWQKIKNRSKRLFAK